MQDFSLPALLPLVRFMNLFVGFIIDSTLHYFVVLFSCNLSSLKLLFWLFGISDNIPGSLKLSLDCLYNLEISEICDVKLFGEMLHKMVEIFVPFDFYLARVPLVTLWCDSFFTNICACIFLLTM